MSWKDMDKISRVLNSLEETCKAYSWELEFGLSKTIIPFKYFLCRVEGWNGKVISDLTLIFDKEYNIIRSKFDKNSYYAIQNGMDIAARRNEFNQKLENLNTAFTEFADTVDICEKELKAELKIKQFFNNWKAQVDDCIKFVKDIYSWLEAKSKEFKRHDAKRVFSKLKAKAKDLFGGAKNELKNARRNAKTEASDVSEDIENAKIYKATLGKSNKEKIDIYKQQKQAYEDRKKHLEEKDGGLYRAAYNSNINLKIFFDNLAQYSLLKAKMSKFLSLINELKLQIDSAASSPDATQDFKDNLSPYKEQLGTLEQKGREKFEKKQAEIRKNSEKLADSLKNSGYDLDNNKQLLDVVNCLSANSENTKTFGDELASKQNKFIIEMKKLERLINSCKENLQKLGCADVTVDPNAVKLDSMDKKIEKLETQLNEL